MPDESFFTEQGQKFFTKEYVEHIEQVRNYAQKNFTSTNQKKYFFHYGYDANFGEQRLAEYFKSKGYEIIKPENLPLDEQLNILTNCENFASTEGSCSHNSVFMKDNTEVLLIPRSATRAVNGYQAVFNQIRNQNIFYVDTALALYATQDHGPFCYIISEQLRKFFGEEVTEKYTATDFEIFLQYFRFSLENNFTANEKSTEYYSVVISEFFAELKQQKDLLEKYKVTVV